MHFLKRNMGEANAKSKPKSFENPIGKLKATWTAANPYQRHRLCYKFAVLMEDVIQVRVFTERPTGILGYFPAITFIAHCALLIYTVFYYTSSGNFFGFLPCFCVFGLMASVSTLFE